MIKGSEELFVISIDPKNIKENSFRVIGNLRRELSVSTASLFVPSYRGHVRTVTYVMFSSFRDWRDLRG